ncbi:putative ABC transporter permease, partial [Streptococcus gordonii]|nr:putative ABC transporter permease [Streptococcus gordonii]
LNYFNLFWVFFVCSVLGLILEEVWHMVVVDPGVYQDRAGMLFGPFSPIYGFGAVLMTMALHRFYKKTPLIIFLVSALIGGAFEVFVGWFMQTSFGVVSWSYSHIRL